MLTSEIISKYTRRCLCGESSLSVSLYAAGLQELAKYPNVYAKVSGMFATDPKWSQQSIEDVVKPVLEIFGIDRLRS